VVHFQYEKRYMPPIKTGISIPEDLARRADALAEELNVTRSQLFSRALSEFIERYENVRLLERLNEAYSEGPDEDESELLERAREYHRDRFGPGAGGFARGRSSVLEPREVIS
jgi:predicted DNA-binding protein